MRWLVLLAAACGSSGASIDAPAHHGDALQINNPDALTCTATSACWSNCLQYDTPISTCKSNCGLGDGVSCWQLCTDQGTTVSTCKSYCDAGAGCEAALCWENCGANAVAVSTCVTYCGIDTTTCGACSPARSAHDQCTALCVVQSIPSSTCASYCG